MSFAPGDHEFTVIADDGVRLYVDGVAVIDKWIDQAPTTYRTHAASGRGSTQVVMEYYENSGGAVARLAHARSGIHHPPRPRTARSTGTHRTRQVRPAIPVGPPDLERDDDTLDFDWGGGSPGAGIAADRFVARWTKTVALSAGYTGSAGPMTTECGRTSTTCR